MYNTAIVNLEKQIIEAINNSRLHVGTISLILNKVNVMVKNTLDEEILREKNEIQLMENNEIENMIEVDDSI